ncbi:DUF1918 domain-containing protein [Georgenia satyanarayanai]|uniref:DUF1918 domain-containing protein n=1 Tax=Georgenia satyanarayanai TaxID=860221 RepID=UPI0012659BE0|nr:DUF1918 domain-containing protein [Georgenia satyanarayanai]
MSAAPGDRVVVRAQHGADRDGEVVAVRGADGGPPYVVRWSRSGEESVFFPGPGTVIEPAERASTG